MTCEYKQGPAHPACGKPAHHSAFIDVLEETTATGCGRPVTKNKIGSGQGRKRL